MKLPKRIQHRNCRPKRKQRLETENFKESKVIPLGLNSLPPPEILAMVPIYEAARILNLQSKEKN